MPLPDDLKEALKAINHHRYQENKEKIKIAQNKYKQARREDAAYVDKDKLYQSTYYLNIVKPKREANKEQSKEYYINVVKPKREALKLLKHHNDVFV